MQIAVTPSAEDPRQLQPIDQLVLKLPGGEVRSVRLYKGMTAKALRRKLGALPALTECIVYCDRSQQNAAWIDKLLDEFYPGSVMVESSQRAAGTHTVRSKVTFTVNDHYFRSLAKMAFHYYLCYNTLGFSGHEPWFAQIREFIRNGGERDLHFRSISQSPVYFGMPFGEVGFGEIAPDSWSHFLAADDVGPEIVVHLGLFWGPETVRAPSLVVLGAMPRTGARGGAWGHVLTWEPGLGRMGSVEPLDIVEGYAPAVISAPGIQSMSAYTIRRPSNAAAAEEIETDLASIYRELCNSPGIVFCEDPF